MNTTMATQAVIEATAYMGPDAQVSGIAVKIVLDAKCEPCNGVGIVQAPEWAEWIPKFEQSGISKMKCNFNASPHGPIVAGSDGCARCARERKFLADNPEPVTPEEEPCAECEGVGMIPTPAGLAVLNFVRRYAAS